MAEGIMLGLFGLEPQAWLFLAVAGVVGFFVLRAFVVWVKRLK
jgi:hypothetical protein